MRGAAVAVLILFVGGSAPAPAQRGRGNQGGARNIDNIVNINGRVTLPDGSPPPAQATIYRVCAGQQVPEAYTEPDGGFGFRVGKDAYIAMEDAATYGVDSRGRASGDTLNVGGITGDSERFSTMKNMGSVDLTGCEIRVALDGYVATPVNLTRRNIFDNPDIGVIVIHPIGAAEAGDTVSVTTATAPKSAQKNFEKASKDLGKGGDPSKAAAMLEKAVEEHPSFAAAWEQLGRARVRMRDEPGALEAYGKSVESDPRYLPPYPGLIKLQMRAQQWESLKETTESYLQMNPSADEERFYHAIALVNLGRPVEAEEALEPLFALDGVTPAPEVRHFKASLMARRGDYAGAAGHLESFLADAPRRRRRTRRAACWPSGRLWELRPSVRATRLFCFLALAACPSAADNSRLDAFRGSAQLRLAEGALACHDVDQAQRRLQQALELIEKGSTPEQRSRAYERLGDVHLRRNQLRTAQSYYERALDATPREHSTELTAKLASAATRRGHHHEAAVLYERAAAAEPSAELLLRLGEARLRASQREQAAEAFQQAIETAAAGSLDQAKLHESVARRYLWLANDRTTAATHAESALAIRRAHKADAPEQFARTLRSRAARTSDKALAEERLAELPTAAARQIRSRRLEADGDLTQAFRQQWMAVNELREAGAGDLDFASALEALAGLQVRRGYDGLAITLQDEALDLRRELGASDAPASLTVLQVHAGTLERDGRPDVAESVLIGYLGELEASADRPAARAQVRGMLGEILLRMGRFEEAAEQFRTAARLSQEAWGDGDGRLQPLLEKLADALRRAGKEDDARKAESRLALLSFSFGATREPPQGSTDTGTWLSEPAGITFVGLALSTASLGLVWLGWTTITTMQPALESGFRPGRPRIEEAPRWRAIERNRPRYPVSFRGRGGPLFGIWSVNMALTLITLGVYFFWGKVRTRRYFWSQAELAGDRFTFRGTGAELLFGWLKAAPVLALLLWGPGLLQLVWEDPNAGYWGAGIALTLVGLLWPLAEIGATRYRLSRTSWRAIRFSFRGRIWPFMKIWLTGWFLWIVSLGLWTPFYETARRRYLMEHTQFGDAKLTLRHSRPRPVRLLLGQLGPFPADARRLVLLLVQGPRRTLLMVAHIPSPQRGREPGGVRMYAHGSRSGDSVDPDLRHARRHVRTRLALDARLGSQTALGDTDADRRFPPWPHPSIGGRRRRRR